MPAANIAASLRNNRQRLGNAGKANDVPAVYDPNQSHSALSGLVVMPLRQYFCGVGGILLAALLAANIGLSASSAQLRAEVPLNEIFNLQIHSSHKWPDKVILVVAEHQPLPVAETRRKQHATSTWLSIQNSQTPRDAFAALNDPSADAPADYIAAQ